jgi:hypothetical protein
VHEPSYWREEVGARQSLRRAACGSKPVWPPIGQIGPRAPEQTARIDRTDQAELTAARIDRAEGVGSGSRTNRPGRGRRSRRPATRAAQIGLRGRRWRHDPTRFPIWARFRTGSSKFGQDRKERRQRRNERRRSEIARSCGV